MNNDQRIADSHGAITYTKFYGIAKTYEALPFGSEIT